MTEKLNILLAVTNTLVFIVMLIALFLQRKSIKQNQQSINNSKQELRTTITGLKTQFTSMLISHKQKELEFIDKNSSVEAQQKYNTINNEIEKLNREFEKLTNQIKG